MKKKKTKKENFINDDNKTESDSDNEYHFESDNEPKKIS